MAHRYAVLGLSLRCSVALPRLDPEPAASGPTVDVDLGGVPAELWAGAWQRHWQSALRDHRGRRTLRVERRDDDGFYRFRYSDGTDFLIAADGRRVWTRWRAPNALEDTATYLLGPVLGFVLQRHGIYTLHASAVVVDGRAIALAGQPAAGKSTTAAAFALAGDPVLTDDITALLPDGEAFMVQADSPLLRLWPGASTLLYGTPRALPRLSETWDKRFLHLTRSGVQARQAPRPLAAVYALDGETVAGSTPRLLALHGQEALMALVGNSYVNHLLRPAARAAELDLLTRIAHRVPIHRLCWPQETCPPAAVRTLLRDHARRLAGPAVAG